MAEHKTPKEQEQYLKSQGLKILDLLVKIAPTGQGMKEGWKVTRETTKALTMAERTFETGNLSASDGNMNRLAMISHHLSNELFKLSRKDGNWWIEASGTNLLSREHSTAALHRLQGQRNYLKALREACEGLKTLAAVVFAQSISNVKGFAKLYMPSIPMIDGMVTKDTRKEYDVCIGLIDSTLKNLSQAIQAVADMNKLVDRFLTLMNAQDQRSALKVIKYKRDQSTAARSQ